jgi:hypothetical protein
LTTAVGVLAIDEVTSIAHGDISADDAERSGAVSLDALLAELDRRDGELYLIAFHVAGADPRRELRTRADLSTDDLGEIGRRLARLDGASRHGPWTSAVLRLIAERPGVRAGDLADQLGRERLAFKADVRKLKALGLTESLDVGYRLSPRGRAWLDRPCADPRVSCGASPQETLGQQQTLG